MGAKAKKAVEDARESLSKILNAGPDEIVFTSGGTESNNLAIFGTAFAHGGGHIIASQIEHISVLSPIMALEKRGYEVTRLPVDHQGVLDPASVSEAIRDDTFLISIGHANNEIGTVQKLKKIGGICKREGIALHTDACQSFTKEDIDVKAQGLDLVSINSHKIHGPKGIGALYVRNGLRLEPCELGAKHEHGLRAGTENVPAIVGMAEAARISLKRGTSNMRKTRDMLIDNVLNTIPACGLNGARKRRLANNANFFFEGIEGESAVLRLDALGVACSTGSACSSESLEPSHVLSAIGLSPEIVHSSLRFTNSHDTTGEDIEYAVCAIEREIRNLRDLSPIWRD